MSSAIQKPFDESLRAQLWANKARFVNALDGQIEFDRFAVVAMNAVRRTPKLAECDIASVVESIAKAAELGLEPNGPLGHAYLIPYRKECKLIIGYKGWVHVMFRGGGLQDAEAHVVYEEDLKNGFKLQFGAQTILKHPFSFTPADKRGKKVGAYAVLRFMGGGVHVEPMTWDEVMKAKATSPSSGNADSPWQLWEDEMAKKTALKRGAKWAPTGRDYTLLARAHQYDDETADGTLERIPATVAPPLHVVAGEAPAEKQPEPPRIVLTDRAEAAEKPERKIVIKDVPAETTVAADSPLRAAAAKAPAPGTFEAICAELYAAQTLDAVDAIAEKHTGWMGEQRGELAARFKQRRVEVSKGGGK